MNFNAPTFLFFFLPVGLLLYYAVDWRYKNLVALAASLVFYAWGQLFYLPIMLLVILVNFYTARRIEGARERPQAARKWLWAGIVFDIGLLLFFKIIAGYGSAWLFFLPAQTVERLASNPIPLGLSFITFQVISYLIDIDNEIVDSEKSLLNFSLYILLFPKIILGPITRYRDLAGQLLERKVTAEGAASGARRFIIGLAKKVLIADALARIVNPAFDLSSPNFSTGIAWLVLVGYAIQLYFDFSGYTDMAIGLGQMLGFRFVENFNYPYISRSISEFWRRWHISLSSWFRDYVFLPLEFARRGTVRFRQQTNILVVFLLTGLWHGVTLNFVLWGLIHGLALALEMTGFGRWLKKAWPPLQHFYTLLVVLLGWVFFRSPDPVYAGQMIARLAGSGQGITPLSYSITRPLPFVDNSVWLALLLGLLFSLPVLPAFQKAWRQFAGRSGRLLGSGMVGADLFLLFLLVSSVAAAVGSTYVSSIYGGF
jgi:alginate O-acetyltransferase complex protein AlgI